VNTADYIASGILESYLLGSATEQEQREVSCMAAIYPEIQEALHELSWGLEQYSRMHAVNPPAHLKEKIAAALDFEPAESKENIKVDFKIHRNSNFRWAMAAACLFAVMSVLFWLEKQKISSNLQTQTTNLKEQKALLDLYTSNTHQQVAMLGTEKFLDAKTTVFWDKNKNSVQLSIQKLPSISGNKQFQLWAIVDGKPTDLGVFDETKQVLKMKNVKGAQAFAITIEPKGGSSSPSLDQMCVLGKIISV
jgi:anti-sigma-K factor RskA